MKIFERGASGDMSWVVILLGLSTFFFFGVPLPLPFFLSCEANVSRDIGSQGTGPHAHIYMCVCKACRFSCAAQ